MQHVRNTNAHALCIKICIPKRDGHTYIPTQNEMRSRISCLTLRRSAIIFMTVVHTKFMHTRIMIVRHRQQAAQDKTIENKESDNGTAIDTQN